MEVTITDLEFSNMFSYGANNKLSINKNKITQLTAPNGNGKSTIALIIQELLYSKNIKNIKKGDILNRHSNSKEWSGTLSFTASDKLYKIIVKRVGATSKVTLLENGVDISDHKVPDTYKKLSKILNIDFEVFSQLTYQSSIDLLDFIKATDTNRKKFLINLFGLEKYLVIGDDLKVVLGNLEQDLRGKNGELKSVDSFLNENPIGELKNTIEVPMVDETLRNKIARLQNELEDYQRQCKKIDSNNAFVEERDSLRFDMSLSEPTIGKDVLTNIEYYQQEIIKNKNQIDNIQKQLRNIDLTDTCYACGQHIDNTKSLSLKENLESELDKLLKLNKNNKDTLTDLQIEKEDYLKLASSYAKNQKAIEKFEQLSLLIDNSIPTNYPDYEQIEKDLKSFTNTLKLQEKEKQKVVEYNEQVNIYNTKLEALIEQKRQFLVRQHLLNDDILSLNSKIKNITILRKAFSTTGIVAFKLENLTKELEDTINKYLADLSDGKFQIIFRLEGEKLNIIVVSNGKEAPIETFSGGEFSRVQMAILLSIRSLLSKIGGTYINLLFLDEITGVLDDSGKEKLIEVLQEETNLNVFLISHDFTHPLIEKLSIIKENDISYIE